MTDYGVILFHTTSAAIQAEKLLNTAGLTIKLIPPPREFSSDCGIAVRFDWNQYERIKSLLDATGVEISAIHQ